MRLFDTVKPDQQDTASAVPQQVFADYSECLVEFEKIGVWQMEEDNAVNYKISQERDTSGDWIGLYKVICFIFLILENSFCTTQKYLIYLNPIYHIENDYFL